MIFITYKGELHSLGSCSSKYILLLFNFGWSASCKVRSNLSVGQVQPGWVGSGQTRLGRVGSDEARSGWVKQGWVWSGQVRYGIS